MHDLAVRGIHQLTLLQAIPKERLTALGRRYLCELERKFPNFKASDDLGTSHGGFVESPIDTDSAQLMSDRDWLRAIGHYSGNKSHREFLKGGAQQLSGVLQGLIKEQPERFYQLLNSIPDNIDDAYVTAYINALAESNAPVEWFFEVIRRFGRQPNRSIAITIFWSLAKRSEAILPDDIRAILEDSVYGSPDSYELSTQRRGKELYNAYLNSERGTAYRALMGFLRHRIDDERAVAERWRFVEFASTDPSLALRAGAIEELLYLMHLDKARAVILFEQLMKGHEELICSHYADDFTYHALHKQYGRVHPYIQLMMDAEDQECQQRGAELACIASISPQALETETNIEAARKVAEEILTGKVAWRRGAARIYAFNIVDGPREQCATALTMLLNDEDAQVSRYISSLFHRLRAEHMTELQSFIKEFARSRAFQELSHFFAKYLWENSTISPELTLSLIAIALQNSYSQEKAYRGHRSGEEFVRSVLHIYNDPTSDEVLRHSAMDIFDQLMKRFPSQSQQVLDEWDKR